MGMTLFVTAIIFFIVALALLIVKWPTRDGAARVHPVVGIGIILFAVLLVFLSTVTTVGPKKVGVITSFGKPTGSEDSGWSHKKPWEKMTEINGAVQTNEYKDDDGCIYARIGDGSRSCVTLTIRWQIKSDKADVIFADYRNKNESDPTEGFRQAVVSTQLKASVQDAISDYNPIANLEVVDGSNAASASELSFAPDYNALGEEIEDLLSKREGADLYTLKSVTVSYVSLSKSTQKTIDAFIAEVGKTRVAAQRKSTAKEESEANKVLRESVDNNPGVLQSKCLDLIAEAIEQGYGLPAGFQCLGGGGSVVIPSK